MGKHPREVSGPVDTGVRLQQGGCHDGRHHQATRKHTPSTWNRYDATGVECLEGEYVLRAEFSEGPYVRCPSPGPQLAIPFTMGGGPHNINPPEDNYYADVFDSPAPSPIPSAGPNQAPQLCHPLLRPSLACSQCSPTAPASRLRPAANHPRARTAARIRALLFVRSCILH